MSRTLSLEGLQALFAEHTGDVICEAITITHDDLVDPVRLVSNTEPISWNGNEYSPFPFEITLAPDVEETMPVVQVVIDNIHRDLIANLRSWESPPDVELEIFRIDADRKLTREIGTDMFSLRTASWDAHTIRARLAYEYDVLNEPAVKDRFTPNLAPGLF